MKNSFTKGTSYTSRYLSPLGAMTMASDGTSLTGLWFDGQKYYGDTLSAEQEERLLPVFNETQDWLDSYFRGETPCTMPCVRFTSGSAFRHEVWQILTEIPYGKTTTYGEIANVLARRHGLRSMSAQAVGGAVGHNPISIIVPCHRVLGFNGKLTGYAGGAWRKARLLEMEGALLINDLTI